LHCLWLNEITKHTTRNGNCSELLEANLIQLNTEAQQTSRYNIRHAHLQGCHLKQKTLIQKDYQEWITWKRQKIKFTQTFKVAEDSNLQKSNRPKGMHRLQNNSSTEVWRSTSIVFECTEHHKNGLEISNRTDKTKSYT